MRFLEVNGAAMLYYGYSRDEFLKLTAKDIRHVDDNEADSTTDVVRLPSLNIFYNSSRRQHVKKNGDVFYAQVYSYTTRFEGKMARVMLAVDINNEVLIERQNAELTRLTRQQKNRLDDILSSVSEVIWSVRAADNEMVYINPVCASVLGHTEKEFIGSKTLMFDIVHPEDIQSVKDAWMKVLVTGQALFEYRVIHKDGTIRFIINNAVKKAHNGEEAMINGIAVDVTRLRHTEDALRERVAEINNILESITDGFFAVDENWNFTYINKEFESILLRRREDLLGKNLWANLPYAEDLKLYSELHRAMNEHVSVHLEEHIPILKRWFNINAYPAKKGLAVYMRDISEEKKKLIRIQTQHDRLRDIAWIQSHKVRSPVATILGLAELLNMEDPADPTNKEVIDNIKEATNNLDKVIREIADKTNDIDQLGLV